MPYKDYEKQKENSRNYYRNNRSKIRRVQRRYRVRTLEEEKARHRRNGIKKYGITENDYLKMFEKQKGVCSICSKPQLTKRLYIDHNHTTGKIRGLLCENCNRGLGMFKDDKNILLSAIGYLDKIHD